MLAFKLNRLYIEFFGAYVRKEEVFEVKNILRIYIGVLFSSVFLFQQNFYGYGGKKIFESSSTQVF